VVKDLNNHDFETFMRLLSDSFVVQKLMAGLQKIGRKYGCTMIISGMH
jgi:hypothetical protein